MLHKIPGTYSQPQGIIWEGHYARAVILAIDPKDGNNIVVQEADDQGWRDTHQRYNSMRDDFAYTNAVGAAKRLDAYNDRAAST